MSTAADRGWGPGWPACQPSMVDAGFAVDGVRFPGGVRLEICELVTLLVRETRNRGYRFGTPTDPSYGCWGYNCRAIAGTDSPSNHSWGLAVDINAPTNPQHRPLTTDMPPWMPQLWRSYGFGWGGDYQGSTPDPMHYEFLGTPADAARHTTNAHAAGIGRQSVPLLEEIQPMFFKDPSGAIFICSGSLVALIGNLADLAELQKAAADPGYVAPVGADTAQALLKASTSRST